MKAQANEVNEVWSRIETMAKAMWPQNRKQRLESSNEIWKMVIWLSGRIEHLPDTNTLKARLSTVASSAWLLASETDVIDSESERFFMLENTLDTVKSHPSIASLARQ